MFFYVGKECPLLSEVNPGLFLDKGWTPVETPGHSVWYKGYSLDCNLFENISQILAGYTPSGIWCLLSYANGTYQLKHSATRGFPLFAKHDEFTNLPLEGFSEIAAPSAIPTIVNQDFDSAAQVIKDNLVQNCLNFVKFNNAELNLWCTGGIDSTALIAILEYAKIPYNLYVAKPRSTFENPRRFEGTIEEYSSPLLSFCRDNFWGYEFLSVFSKPMTLVTGFYGDEYLGRGPQQIARIANIANTPLFAECTSSHYMYRYLRRNFSKTIGGNQKLLTELEAKTEIFQSVIGDFQMWHFDNVTVFSPYYELAILETVLRLDPGILLQCVLGATMQKKIIELTLPDVLKLVDSNKNTLAGRKNFFDNLHTVDLHYCKRLDVV